MSLSPSTVMKSITRSLRLASIFVWLAIVSSVSAFQHDHDSPPNIDLRGAAPAALAPAHAAGVDRMKARVPGAHVVIDPVLGRPSFATRKDGLLTGPDGGGTLISKTTLDAHPENEPHRVVKAFLDEHRDVFGHDSTALTGAVMKRDDVAKHNGLRTTVWEQQVGGIPVFEAVLQSHVTKRGELVNVASRFIANPAQARGPAKAAVTARAALVSAAQSLQLTLLDAQITIANAPVGVDQYQKLRTAGLAGDADAKLIWLPMSGTSLRLCWDVMLTPKTGGETFRALVDAQTGVLQVRRCLTEYVTNASFRVFTSDSPSPFSPGYTTLQTTQPPVVARSLITLSALDATASPDGWIPDGTNETLGNNVDAHTDTNGDNLQDLPRPQGSPSRVFDFPQDLALAPSAYSQASVVQLFYWCNWMHDRLYQLGFTESAGNFQSDNFGRGGLGGDALQADAQDGSGNNNANMTTPSDGSAPRMQMFLFTGPTPDRDGSVDAEIVLHEYTHGLSNRLVGGGVGISSLQTSGMGEGWSDFYALSMLSAATDNVDGCYAYGAYSGHLFLGLTQSYYFGVRRYPYSTDMTKNPLTFSQISQTSVDTSIPRSPIFTTTQQLFAGEVHNSGEVWCSALWEVRANLIKRHGFAIGNELALQLVTDGMKLCPPQPSFLQARDAIIQADVVNNAGANHNDLWAGFAKRGMGFSATSPDSSTTSGVVEAFDNGDASQVTPTSSFAASCLQGGAFEPVAMTYTLTNGGTAALSWTAVHAQPWVVATPPSGTLAGGASTTVTISFTAAANSFAPGSYHDTLDFTNDGTAATQPRGVTLDVLPAQRVFYFPMDVDPGWTKSGAWAFGTPLGGGGGSFGFPDPTSGATGTKVYGVNLSGNHSTTLGTTFVLTSSVLNFTGKTNCVLQFQRWLNSDFPPFVQLTIEVSTNGTTYTRVWGNGFEIAENAWGKQHYNIAALTDNQPTVYLRWTYRITKTGARPMSGWNIDDVEIYATTAPPVANAASPSVSADTSSGITLTGSASSGGTLSYQLLTLPTRGLIPSFNPATGALTYTPAHGFSGADSFTFQVSDGFASSTPATISLNVSPLPDSDGDGLPDAWELLHFGSITGGDPALDDDGDGLTNLQEYLAGTNPKIAASTFRIRGITRAVGGNLAVTWDTIGGVRYLVQFSDTLGGNFTDIVRPITAEIDPSPTGTPSTQTFIDDFTLTGGASTRGARFYRIQIKP